MKVYTISKSEANDFFKKYEHLGNSGLGVWHYGLFIKKELIAVVSYGTPCFSSNRGFISRIAKQECLKIIQLCRGGTKNTTYNHIPSQIIKLTLKEIRKKFGETLIVAYSDTKWNEIGTIYQSCNAIYTGKTNPKGQSNYIVNGKNVSGWTLRKKHGTRDLDKLKTKGLSITKIPLNRKHRYVFINTPKLKKRFVLRRLAPYTLKYPKRHELNVDRMRITLE